MAVATVVPQEAPGRSRLRGTPGNRASFTLHETCLSEGVPPGDLERFDNIVFARRLVPTGARLFGPGDKFTCIYSIRSGSFRTSLVDAHGREQVTGFFMRDELLGMDGLGNGCYNVCAIAMEDSDVWAIPHVLIAAMPREVPSLQHRLHSVLACEIARNQALVMRLGSMDARERFAHFLLELSGEFSRLGHSRSIFRLRMARAEIASYIGVTLETVSRLFASFQKERLIEARLRDVALLDLPGLARVARGDRLPASPALQ